MESTQLLANKGLTLKGAFTQTIVVAIVFVCCKYTNMYHTCIHIFLYLLSALDEPSEDGESPDVAEMPIDLDIEVESVGLDENEIEQLRQDTRWEWNTDIACLHEGIHVHACVQYVIPLLSLAKRTEHMTINTRIATLCAYKHNCCEWINTGT